MKKNFNEYFEKENNSSVNNKLYFVLDDSGNPMARYGDEVNPYIFYFYEDAIKFAEQENKKDTGNWAKQIVMLITQKEF